jgi:hypothetical protein
MMDNAIEINGVEDIQELEDDSLEVIIFITFELCLIY